MARPYRFPWLLTGLALTLALAASACGSIMPGGSADGPVGFGEIHFDNQTSGDLEVELGMTWMDDITATVPAGQSEVLTNLGGGFGVAPEICDETTSLKITRIGDGEVILDDDMCNADRWQAEDLDEYERDFTFAIFDPLGD